MGAGETRWTTRLLAAAITLIVAAASGVLVADVVPRDPAGAVEEVRSAAPPALPSPAPAPDVDRAGDAAARLLSGLTASLPTPDPAPANAYAATPEVHHGQLEIPSIGLSQPFFEGVTLTAINRGPSHWPGTAMPGELGNVVIAGHRTTYTRPFWDLDLVQPGDQLIFTMADGSRHVYVLDRTEVVDDSAIHIIDQSFGYRATLFGCHPKGSARQRIVGHFTLSHSTPAGT